MRVPKFISNNVVLKITSVNAVVIGTRLIISFFVIRLITSIVGEAGYAKIGNLRNLMAMLTSSSTLGVFNGVVKYVSQLKNDHEELNKVFKTTTLFVFVGTLTTCLLLFFASNYIAVKFFGSIDFNYIPKLLSVIVPCIALHRVFNAVINGLSDYKIFAKVELIAYVLGVLCMLFGLYNYSLTGVLVAIAITPIFQFLIILFVFGKKLKQYVNIKTIRFGWIYKNQLLAFMLMSFVSTFLLNYIEIDIRGVIAHKVNADAAGNWTAVSFVSKNYMVFISNVLTLYVLPRFANINSFSGYKTEVFNIYKTILPIFALGMLVVFFMKDIIIAIIYPTFNVENVSILFKWQLLGDFVRLASLVLAHQFLAKKLVRSFVATELISIGLFYVLSVVFVKQFQTEGIVMAHFLRYVIYFMVVIVFLSRYFIKQKRNNE